MGYTFKIGEELKESYPVFLLAIRQGATDIFNTKGEKIEGLKTKESELASLRQSIPKKSIDESAHNLRMMQIGQKENEILAFQKKHLKLDDCFINAKKIEMVIQSNGNIQVIGIDGPLTSYQYEGGFNPFTKKRGQLNLGEKDNIIFATAEAARFTAAENLVKWHLEETDLRPAIWGFSNFREGSSELKPNPFWNNYTLFTEGLGTSILGIDLDAIFDPIVKKMEDSKEYQDIMDEDVLKDYNLLCREGLSRIKIKSNDMGYAVKFVKKAKS